jgi:hypothetical protein
MFKFLSFIFTLLRFQKKREKQTASDEQFWEHLDGAEFSVVVDREVSAAD